MGKETLRLGIDKLHSIRVFIQLIDL
ncbi:hypothetical protein EZS27_036585 [termite gut metagenome]|uniref:Uncharacterized protein n=1 Tax=termite gut metagenome TaxID=433724 RepID=A0A5J4PV56_9ZZZZ